MFSEQTFAQLRTGLSERPKKGRGERARVNRETKEREGREGQSEQRDQRKGGERGTE